ncbi:hypothetical protein HYV57_05645 [Candidatus Peregrinibacteria bacterium]|nr:hypothetical protein [Candidatus Peregrinibacteria bacterium]
MVRTSFMARMTRKIFSSFLLFSLLLSQTAYASVAVSKMASFYFIRGTVTESSTRAPLSQVVILSETSGKQAVSSETGRYTLQIPATDTHQKLRVEKDGYETLYAEFNVYGNTTYNIALTAIPDLTVSNIIVTPSSEPKVTDPVSFDVTIKNNGKGAVDPSKTPFTLTIFDQKNWGFEYEFQSSAEKIPSGGEYVYHSDFLPYEERALKLSNNPHVFTVTVDATNTIHELDENNNTTQTNVVFKKDTTTIIDNLYLSDETQSNSKNPLLLEWTAPKRGDYIEGEVKYFKTDLDAADPYQTAFYATSQTSKGIEYSVGYLEDQYLDDVSQWSTLSGTVTSCPGCSDITYVAEDLSGQSTYYFILKYKKQRTGQYVYSNVMRVNFYGSRDELIVSLSPDSPKSSAVPKGATAVPFLAVDLKNTGSENVEINGMTFHRIGVGSAWDFNNVYLYNGDERLTSGHLINTDTNEVSFNNIDVTVPAGETFELTLKADISAVAATGNENAFELAGADKINSSAKNINFNGTVIGEYMRISASTVGSIKIAKNGSIPNPHVGQMNVKIAEFQLTAANEDMSVQKIALAVKGNVSASADLSNFKLYQSTTELATDDMVNEDDIMTFSLATPFEIKKGDNRIFYVYADVSAKADPNDTIQIFMEEDTDLVAIGTVYGYGAQVNRNDYDGDQTTDSDGDGSVPDSSNSIIEGGQVTIAFNGPVATDVALNGKDVPFLKLNLSTQTNIEVQKLTLTITAASANTSTPAANLWNSSSMVANFSDIKIIDADSGAWLMGPKELTSTTSVGTGYDISQTLTFTDSWPLAAGKSKNLVVTMDIANQSALSGESIYVTLNPVSTTDGISDTNGHYITNIVPSSAIQGNNMTIKMPTLTIGLASSPVSDTFVKGSSNVPAVGFTFTAGTAADVLVTDVVLQGYFDENGDGTYGSAGSDNGKYLKDTVQFVDIYDGSGNKISSVSKNVSNTGSVTFSGLTWTLKAGIIEKLEVRVQISTTSPQNNTNDRFSFDLSSVTAQKADDGSSITVTPGSPNGGATPSRVITVTSAGTLSIANADNVVTDSKIIAGVNGVLVSKFKATATDEDFMITKLNLQAINLSQASTNDVEYVYFKYPDKNGITVTSPKVLLTGTTTKLANFTGLSFYAPKDKTVEFSVYMDTDTIESGATLSGDRIRIDFDATDATDEFEAIGQSSGYSIVDNVTSSDADVSNNNHVALYKTVPTFATNSTSSGCPTNSTKPVSGTNNIYCFDVTADSNGSVDLYKVTLQVAGSSITPGTLSLYDYNDQSTVLATASVSNNMAAFKLSTPDTIGAGGKVTYIVKGSLTIDTNSQNNSISTRVQDDTSFATNAAAASVSGNTVWSDRSASSHSTTTTDWTNGYKLSGLPTDQVSMSL